MFVWTDGESSWAGDPAQNICAVIRTEEKYIPAGKDCTDPPAVDQSTKGAEDIKTVVHGLPLAA